MQNRYFGDVGDFGKYGLLRILHGCADADTKLRLGVVWYLFPDETHNADGKHLGYLRKPRDYRDCDEQLFDLLHSTLFNEADQLIAGARQIKHAETSGMLPEGTLFYSEPLAFLVGLKREAREQLRNDWYAGVLATTTGTDLVFLDPDNGIECKIDRIANKGPKYVFWDEITGFVHRGESVVVYHHLGRNGTHAQQVKGLEGEMRRKFPDFEISAVRYRRGNGRAYFIIASPQHKDLLRQRLTEMRSGPWNRHFDFE